MSFLYFYFISSISAPSATIYAYLGEFTKTERRTMMISFASVAVGLSSISVGSKFPRMTILSNS